MREEHVTTSLPSLADVILRRGDAAVAWLRHALASAHHADGADDSEQRGDATRDL